MSQLADFWTTVDAAAEARWAWQRTGPRISSDDLKAANGNGVVRITTQEIFGDGGAATGSQPVVRPGAGKPAAKAGRGPLVLTFGKYRGQLAVDVRENDPSYWAWIMRDMGWFATKARAAGLVDDEETD